MVPLPGTLVGSQLKEVQPAAAAEEREEESQAQEEGQKTQARQEEALQDQSAKRLQVRGGTVVVFREEVQEIPFFIPLLLKSVSVIRQEEAPLLCVFQGLPVLLQIIHVQSFQIQREDKVILAVQEPIQVSESVFVPVQISVLLSIAVQMQVKIKIQVQVRVII